MLAVLVVSAALWGATPTPSTISPPDKSFTITFPGKPGYWHDILDEGRIRSYLHLYEWADESAKFRLTYVELSPPPPEGLNAAEALDAALDSTIRQCNGRIQSKQTKMVGGRPTMNVTIAVGSKMTIDGVLVYSNPRVYQLLVVHEKGKNPSDMQAFFQSFKIAPGH